MKRLESNQTEQSRFCCPIQVQELIAGGKISVQSHSFIYYGYTTLFRLMKFTGNSMYEIQ